jgi:hypothetical protein
LVKPGALVTWWQNVSLNATKAKRHKGSPGMYKEISEAEESERI